MDKTLLLCTTDKRVGHVIDCHSGSKLHELKDCRPSTNSLCATGGFVLCADRERSFVHAWSWRKEQPRYRCQAPERITCLTCSADGAHCVGGGSSGKLYLWQVGTGQLLFMWDAHFKSATSLSMALCDGYLLSAGADAIIFAWSFADLLRCAHDRRGAPPNPYRTWSEHVLPVSSMCVASCGQHDLIASSSEDQTVRLWRLSDACRGCIHTSELPTVPTILAIHPRHSFVYAGGADGRLYSMATVLEEVDEAGKLGAAGGKRTRAGAPVAGGAAAAGTSMAPGLAGAAATSDSGVRSALASRAGVLRGLAVSTDGTQVYTIAAEAGICVWDPLTLSLLLHLQPTTVFETITPFARPSALLSADSSSASSASDSTTAAASGGSGGRARPGSVFNLQPLKKVAEAPPVDGGNDLNHASLGCVPCDMRRAGGRAVGVGSSGAGDRMGGGGRRFSAAAFGLASDAALAGDADPDEAELPLLAAALAPLAGYAAADTAGSGSSQGGDGGGAGGAEATIRQLRGQLAQMQKLHAKLYEMAADATLGAGGPLRVSSI